MTMLKSILAILRTSLRKGLNETCGRVRVGKYFSDSKNYFRTGDALSPLFFSFVLGAFRQTWNA
jgi:hypothetical protein